MSFQFLQLLASMQTSPWYYTILYNSNNFVPEIESDKKMKNGQVNIAPLLFIVQLRYRVFVVAE